MADGALIEFIPCVFDDRARDDLDRIKSDTAADVEAYEAGCTKDEMICVAVNINGVRRGTLIASFLIENCLVFICNAARVERVEGESMTDAILDLCERWAVSRGAKKTRFWTARKGLAKAVYCKGYRTLYVLEKDLE